jgi:hypothetical protein
MKELMWLVARFKQDPQSVSLIPVFLRLTFEQCDDLERLYESDAFWEGIEDSHKYKAEVSDNKAQYLQAVKDLLEYTGVHPHTVGSASDGVACISVGCNNTFKSRASSAVRRASRRNGREH